MDKDETLENLEDMLKKFIQDKRPMPSRSKDYGELILKELEYIKDYLKEMREEEKEQRNSLARIFMKYADNVKKVLKTK